MGISQYLTYYSHTQVINIYQPIPDCYYSHTWPIPDQYYQPYSTDTGQYLTDISQYLTDTTNHTLANAWYYYSHTWQMSPNTWLILPAIHNRYQPMPNWYYQPYSIDIGQCLTLLYWAIPDRYQPIYLTDTTSHIQQILANAWCYYSHTVPDWYY